LQSLDTQRAAGERRGVVDDSSRLAERTPLGPPSTTASQATELTGQTSHLTNVVRQSLPEGEGRQAVTAELSRLDGDAAVRVGKHNPQLGTNLLRAGGELASAVT